jgi:hypothetical protein
MTTKPKKLTPAERDRLGVIERQLRAARARTAKAQRAASRGRPTQE